MTTDSTDRPDRGPATLDPLDHALETQRGDRARSLVLEIVFHSDLSRIGARTEPRLLPPAGCTLVVGREGPLFSGPAEGAPQALGDPCISREQLTIAARSSTRFAVTSAAKARRPVRLLAPDGSALPPDAPLRTGTLIAVGDRVLLLLARRPYEAETADALGLVGDSQALDQLRQQIRAAAASDATLLVYGESGVGKELVARSIHRCSTRRDHPQLVLNCAAIAENLLESELFGHRRGAFTGAITDKEGFFRAAERGTLFLDEIGELPLAMQSKLLRVLEERKVCPVGGTQEHPVDVRVIAATNRNLLDDIKAGRFREDLYFRLTGLTIEVPALRQRRDDIAPLFFHFLRQSAMRHPELERLWRPVDQQPPPLPMGLIEQLLGCDWPGNVRQLRNAVDKLVVANLHTKGFTLPDALLAELAPTPTRDASGSDPSKGSSAVGRDEPIDEDTLWALLERHDFVQSRVARAAGVSHTTVDRWMRDLGVRRPRDLTRDELQALAQQTGHDLGAMARQLRVSRRGLKLRLAALGLD